MPGGFSLGRERRNPADVKDLDSAVVPLMGKRTKTRGAHRYRRLLPLGRGFLRSNANNSSVLDPSVIDSVSCLYRTRLSTTNDDLLINVAWPRNCNGPAMRFCIEDKDKDDGFSLVLRERKGRESFVSSDSAIDLYWDISSAEYSSGPEPAEGFYIAVVFRRELALLLGDMRRQFVEQLEGVIPTAESSLVGRREQVMGIDFYSTKARFHDDGSDHSVTISRRGGPREPGGPALSVWIDEERVVNVRDLEHSFRGKVTTLVDGRPVQLKWDLHGWWFMFRTRRTLQSLLGREEGQCPSVFSLVIAAYNSPFNMDDCSILDS